MPREILDSRFVECPVRSGGRILPQPPAFRVVQEQLVENWVENHPEVPREEICIATGPRFSPTRQGYSVRLERVAR